MNLSRTAKKFRDQMPKGTAAPKPTKAEKKAKSPPATTPTPQPVIEPIPPVEPTPVAVAPVAAVEPETVPAAPPKKVWPEKVKRPRFVREKAEKRERAGGPALPPRSTKTVAQLLTKNLSTLPTDDASKPAGR